MIGHTWRPIVKPVSFVSGLLVGAILLSSCSFDPAGLLPGRQQSAAAAVVQQQPSPVPEPSATASATAPPTNTAAPTSTATRVPTNSPTASATATETPTPEPTATEVPPPDSLPDVLGRGQTSYAGSIAARAHNVELATRRLNGVMVPPGGVFSFNKALGPSTLDAGFQIGYGITLANNRPKTVPSVAGGICQVATTLFQAAYWAGLEIVERNYHLYWIPRYGQPPTGVRALDATVDDPYADLRFRNNTGNWIRIASWVDGANVGFTILGVDPGWKVQTDGPHISNVVRASQALVREETLTLPPGQTMDVEHAEDGFDATMTRRVYDKDGDLINTYRFTNHYRPSRNVLLVGVRTLSNVNTTTEDPAARNEIVTVPPQTQATAEPVVVRPSPAAPAAIQAPVTATPAAGDRTASAVPTLAPVGASQPPVGVSQPTVGSGQPPAPAPTLPSGRPVGQPASQPPADPPPPPAAQVTTNQPPVQPAAPLPGQQAVPTLPPLQPQAPPPQLPQQLPTATPRSR